VSKLLLYLRPSGNDLVGRLPKGHMPVFPFFTSVSRLNYKPDAFEFKQISEPIADIVKLPNHKKSFADLCDDRALELLQLDQPIFIMWSGGIDSTTVVTGILKNWPREQLSRITILCNHDSIKENRSFFPHIAKNFKIETSDHKIESVLKRGYVITGEMGDQIFGSDIPISTARQPEEILFENYETSAVKMYDAIHNGHGEEYFKLYRPIADEAPFKLKTIFDWCWWLNFSQKWQHIKLRTLVSTSWSDPEQYVPKMIHFFDTVDFQIWSIHNHDKKMPTDWRSYKYEAKKYVIDFTKNDDFMNKLKLPSLQSVFAGTEFNWSIDENWKFLNFEETIQRLRHEY